MRGARKESERSAERERTDVDGVEPSYPGAAGLWLGLGLGGFFDGIVLHQILQWHHMVSSAGYPPDTLVNLEINTLWDGVFHASTYVFVVVGLVTLWRSARHPHARWSNRVMGGSVLAGFGLFNVVEGLVNHQLLGLHHVNETVPRAEWIWWDIGFLGVGALLLAIGLAVWRAGTRRGARIGRRRAL